VATWPFRPQHGIIESLEWKTDVIKCRASESRQCLRTMPRMEWQHKYILGPQDYALAVEVCRANSAGSVDAPEWQSLSEVPPTSAGTVTLPVANVAQIPAYKVGGKAIVWETNMSWEVVAISGVSSGSISISATTLSHGKATIAPLRTCIFRSHLEADRESVNSYVQASAAFECPVTEDLTPGFGVGLGYPNYLDSPVVTDHPEIISGVRESIGRELTTLDSEVGILDRRPLYTSPNRSGVLAWTCQDANAIWNLRRWLHSRKGRQKNFWVASWNDDVITTRDINGGDTNIEIAAVGFAQRWTMPVDMVIVAPDGGIWPIRVTGTASASPGHELLNLSAPFSGSVSLSYISQTCKMTLSRFDSDTVEIHHLAGQQATVAVSIVEDPNTP